MIHSESVLLMLVEILRQTGRDYIDGKEAIEGWKQRYVSNKRRLMRMGHGTKTGNRIASENRLLLKDIEKFIEAEDFLFIPDKYGSLPIEDFWEKWGLDVAGLDMNFYKKMVLDGRIRDIEVHRGRVYADNGGEEPIPEVLDDNGSWEGLTGGGDAFGSGTGGAFRTGSGDCSFALDRTEELVTSAY